MKNGDMMLRVAVIGTFPFKSTGGGPSGRLRNIALALKLASHQPIIMQTGPQDALFTWEGVAVREYSTQSGHCAEAARSRSLFSKLRPGSGRLNAAAVRSMEADLVVMAGARQVDVVIFYNQDLQFAWQIYRTCRRLRIPFVQQYAEIHEARDYPTGWRNTYWLAERAHLHVMPRYADGALVISRALTAWVADHARHPSHPSILLPTIAEVPPAEPREMGVELRLLCVSAGARRDSVPVLLDAVHLLQLRGVTVHLQVVGLSKSALESLNAYRRNLGVEHCVHLGGFVPEAEFDRMVANTDVNILAQTDDVSSRSCFPSRLCELFSSSAPVILSNVGDLMVYFRDGQDCLFVIPGSADSLADKLLWIHENRASAAVIGRNGNIAARNAFAPELHGRSLGDFLVKLVNSASGTLEGEGLR
jgi:glycosyltransferase involved in cell wall biosynthesis